ncbi:hypothetical protein [Streptomyces lancefieldiae]|uniref:Regulatory protein n=1 Tax=Streptomyces lancefieldiae TaxID=3075520 RepID=A0ABU3B1W0_9ACTN|nr:hypothetical protein [Streptomyces sp. DSM 40712]MDT0615827.1 hypothetical protein [Streptomyces sp. DSM 40712]
MSENTMKTATELASQYSVQVTDDLERNVKEQERVSAEITALQQQLAALQHDHALLVNMQQALGITSAPGGPTSAPEPAAAAGAATVPAPREGAATESAPAKQTRGKKAATAPKRAAATKSGAKPASKSVAKPAAKPAAKSVTKSVAKSVTKSTAKAPAKPAAKQPAQPTLVELVRTHLAGQSEPRSAAEVTTALGAAHSDRTIKPTVVRTTLEGLVAKNQAQRTKQGSSVYYTATDAPEPKQDTAKKTPDAQNAG